MVPVLPYSSPPIERQKMKVLPHPDFDQCRCYVAAHLKSANKKKPTRKRSLPAVTISRQTGTRGRNIGRKLREALNVRYPQAEIPWTLFDENLVQQILNDHNLPIDLEKFMPDDAVSEIESSINEILGRHPSQWSLFEHTVETIVRLGSIGHSIIVGRAGNKITQGLKNVVNVRFIGSLDKRVHDFAERHNLSQKDALAMIKKEDAARKNYLRQHFSTDIDDPLSYDLVINTDHLSDESILQILVAAIEAKS
jgi:cytidylate kinase